MACLPKSYSCEHQVTNPFVEYLNDLRNTRFVHVSCLDKARKSEKRTSKKPDALYSDEQTGQQLVVEHKSLLWPPQLAERHKNDHFLVDELLSLLDPEIVNESFALKLPYLLNASRNEIKSFAKSIATTITESKDLVLAGNTIGSALAGRAWRLSLVDPYGFRSEAGIFFSDDLNEINSTASRVSWSQHLNTLLSNAAEKFVTYGNAQRIVLLEIIDLITLPFRMGQLLKGETVPPEINEVWTALYEYFDDDTEGWLYKIEWPFPRCAQCDECDTTRHQEFRKVKTKETFVYTANWPALLYCSNCDKYFCEVCQLDLGMDARCPRCNTDLEP